MDQTRAFDGDPEMPLLWYLRDFVHMTGPSTAAAWACVALHRACRRRGRPQLPDQNVQPDRQVHRHDRGAATASIACRRHGRTRNVPQCGYCQSGQIMQAVALLTEKPKPTDQDIDTAMNGNICRCGTYQRIRSAIKAAAGVKA